MNEWPKDPVPASLFMKKQVCMCVSLHVCMFVLCVCAHTCECVLCVRGGAGISKVVRPLQIKDQLYMCIGGGGGGMRKGRLRSSTTASSGMRHISVSADTV